MDIRPNLTYRFFFDAPFTDLGWTEQYPTRGHYPVLEVLSFERLLELGVDLVNELYVPANLTEADYLAARSTFTGVIFYRLRDTTDLTKLICMPASKITIAPRSDIAQYSDLIIGVNCGVLANAEVLDSTMMIIQQSLEYQNGITPVIKLDTLKSVWMLESKYKALEEARQVVKEAAELPAIMGNESTEAPFNLLAENAKLRRNIDALQARVNALESFIVDQQG